MWGTERFSDLIGKTFKGVRFGEATQDLWKDVKYQEQIFFDFEDGTVAEFVVDGDCCSRSWIEHVEYPAGGIEGAVLVSVNEHEIDAPVLMDHPEHDEAMGGEIKVYNTFFRTSKGDLILEYRNSSNGYYGGSLERVRR